tara:strand:- start:4370 stop:6013 length:1644 start_codon:yes stop_codon:yes gene_type:complete
MKTIPLDAEPHIVYGLLQNLSYKEHLAVSEFVDNSVQSFIDNKEHLKKLKQKNVKVEVKTTDDFISVTDNAGGISSKDFSHAFRLTKPEALKRTNSLNEFGVGMKTAALWFGSRFEICTSALGEKKKYTIIFDLDEIRENQLDSLNDIKEENEKENAHYTIIKISKLNRKIQGSRINKYRSHLKGIYRRFLSDKTLLLKSSTQNASINLQATNETVLNEVYWPDTKGPFIPEETKEEKDIPSFTWEKKIDFEMPSPIDFVKGKAFLSEKFRKSDSGIIIFRRGKGILGSGEGDERYKPSEIYTKQKNESLHATLFIDLDVGPNTPVTSAKTIDWTFEQEQIFLERLKTQLGNKTKFEKLLNEKSTDKKALEENLPLRTMGVGFRRQKIVNISEELKKKHATESVKETKEAIKKFGNKKEEIDNKESNQETISILDPNASILNEDSVTLTWGKTNWKVTVRVQESPSKDWYTYVENQKKREVSVSISVNHPFTKKFLNNDGKVMKSLVRIAAGLTLAEVLVKNNNNKENAAETMRRILNKFLEGDLIQ